MKRYNRFLLVIVLLVCFDQIMKLIVSYCLTIGIDYISITNFFEIRPRINGSTIQKILQNTNSYTIKYYLLLMQDIVVAALKSVLFSLAVVYMNRFFALIKKHSFFTMSCICCSVSAALCYIIDVIFWGGSLDYLCVLFHPTQINGHVEYWRLIFDLKDVYISAMVIIVFISIFYFIIDYLKLSKTEKKDIDTYIKAKVQSIKNHIFEQICGRKSQ